VGAKSEKEKPVGCCALLQSPWGKELDGTFFMFASKEEKKRVLLPWQTRCLRESDRKENTKAYGRLVELSPLKRARC